MKLNQKRKKVLVRSTAALGALLVCGGAVTSSPLVMHADETPSTHTEAVAPTGSALDNTKWTAVDKAKTITRTIHYIDEDGKPVAPDVVESHTGEVFESKNGDTTVKRAFAIVNGVATNVQPKFAQVVSPSVRGYKLKSTQYATIPEQGWSLDGTQVKDDKTGFYTNLSQDEVINVVYEKDGTATELKDEVPVAGYTVLSVKTMTRTIQYQDENGKELHSPEIETVKYETVASDKLTPKEQQDSKNQQVAVVNITRDADGNITGQSAQILNTPAYKLKDVVSPKINGMKLQNSKFKVLSGQYMWLSDKPYVHATLDNGLDQYMVNDEIVTVIYVPQTKKDKKKAAEKNAKATEKNAKATEKNAKQTKNATGTAAAAGSAASDSNDGTGSASASDAGSASSDKGGSGSSDSGDFDGGSGSVGSGSDSGSTLPQTGNKKASSSLLGAGVVFLLSSLTMAWDGIKKRLVK